MSKYSFSDSIRDKATLPLNFEPVPIDLHVDKDSLNQAFDELAEGLSDEDKGELSKNACYLLPVFFKSSKSSSFVISSH